MLHYLEESGYTETATIFKKEAKISPNEKPRRGLFERKWTAILRLQKKVCFSDFLSNDGGLGYYVRGEGESV